MESALIPRVGKLRLGEVTSPRSSVELKAEARFEPGETAVGRPRQATGKRREEPRGANSGAGRRAHLVVVQLLFGEDGLLVPHGGCGAVACSPGGRLPSAAAGAPRPRPSSAPRRAASDGRRTRRPASRRRAPQPTRRGRGGSLGGGERTPSVATPPHGGERAGTRLPAAERPGPARGRPGRGRRCLARLAPAPASAGWTQELPAAGSPGGAGLRVRGLGRSIRGVQWGRLGDLGSP